MSNTTRNAPLRATAAALALTMALTLGACGDDAAGPDGTAPVEYDTSLDRTLLYPHNMEYNPRDVESVSLAFVRIVENHDASEDAKEWTSVLRAKDVMTREAAAGYAQSLDGGTNTDWWQWQDLEAFTTATVSFAGDERPADTDDTAWRIVDARVEPRTDKDRTLPARLRTHHLELRKEGDRWLVHRWSVSSPAPVPATTTNE